MNDSVSKVDFSEIRWKGHWIWIPEDKVEHGTLAFEDAPPPRNNDCGLFRKTFTLNTVPARVPARITADSRYVLFVNGQEIARGPARSQPRRMLYDLFDLTPALKPGKNVLAVYVKVYARPNSYYIPPVANNGLGQTGALVFEADLSEAGWLVSDDTWRATRGLAWDFAGSNMGQRVPVEVVDARKLPAAWQAPDFDDTAWAVSPGTARAPLRRICPFPTAGRSLWPALPAYNRPTRRSGG